MNQTIKELYGPGRKETTIEKIMEDRYGTGIGIDNPITIIWAASRAFEDIGQEAVYKELEQINDIRRKYGKSPAYIN